MFGRAKRETLFFYSPSIGAMDIFVSHIIVRGECQKLVNDGIADSTYVVGTSLLWLDVSQSIASRQNIRDVRENTIGTHWPQSWLGQ